MTPMDVGTKLVELCRSGDFRGALDACYGEDIVSVEAVDMSGQGRETQGLEAARESLSEADWSSTAI